MQNSHMPKISVIMSTYNESPDELRSAIESILNQTWTDFEFIIINDGIKDNAKTIESVVKSYDDSRINYYANEKNMGLIYSLNRGLDIARGEYIARMDADDISLPYRFARQLEYLENHPDVSMVGSWVQKFQADDTLERVKTDITFMDLLIRNCVWHPSVMWRRADFEKYGLRYNPEYIHAEDYKLWADAIRYLKIVNIPEVLLNYRWRTNNITHMHSDKQAQVANQIRKDMISVLTNDVSIQQKLKNVIERQGYWTGLPLVKIRYRKSVKLGYLFGFIPLFRKV